MTLIGPDTTCSVCDEGLDRPYMVTSSVSAEFDARLARWSASVIHFGCLAEWPEREEFARAAFADTLTRVWAESRPRLVVTAEWFLAGEPPDSGERPWFVSVGLARWPFGLHCEWNDWRAYVGGGYRCQLLGPALEAADAVMSEIRNVAPSSAALRTLLDRADVRAGRRSLVDLGRYLETLWGDAAGHRDWKGLEDYRRAAREELIESARVRDEAILGSNELAGRLVVELVIGTPLRCPHCRCRSREMRFIDRHPHDRSFFVCKQCGGSFAGSEALRRPAMPWRRPK